MTRILSVLAGLLLLFLLGYVAWLNPATVEFAYSGTQSFQVPLGWFAIFIFVAGGLGVALAIGMGRLGRRIRDWPERRRERLAQKLDEWEDLAAGLLWDGELDRARNLLGKSWRRQRDRTDTALRLAETYVEVGELQTAHRILQEAVSHDPSSPELRCALAGILNSRGEVSEAIRLLESVRLQYPRAAKVLRTLRDLHERSRRWDEAASAQEAYLDAQPASRHNSTEQTRAIRLRYQAALATPELAARTDALSRLLERAPQSVPIIVSLGDALIDAGHTAEGLKLWEKSLRDHPRSILIERLLAHGVGARERILQLARKSRHSVDTDQLHATAAQAALQANDAEGAAAELEQIRQQDSPALQNLWGRIHRQRGQLEQALRAFSLASESGSNGTRGFSCMECHRGSDAWGGVCPACGAWDSLRSTFEIELNLPAKS